MHTSSILPLVPGVPADQLPADLRKRLGIDGATKSRNRSEAEGKLHLRCHACGDEFHYTEGPRGYEHHQETTGHLRYEVVTTTP